MERVCASAPGKVILFGEHAVVYGHAAVAAALSDLRISVKITSTTTTTTTTATSGGNLHIVMPDLPTPIDLTLDSVSCCVADLKEPPTKEDASRIQHILTNLDQGMDVMNVSALLPVVYLLNRLLAPALMMMRTRGLEIVVRSQDLPVGAGLGSSAAFGVALTAALLRLSLLDNNNNNNTTTPLALGKPCQEHLETINKYAYYSEILLHGTPSGIDNTVATYGGAIDYQKATPSRRSRSDKFDMPSLRMVLVHTRVPRSTKELVAGVRRMHDNHPGVVGPMLQAMGGVAERFRQIIGASWKTVKGSDLLTLVRTNQHLLRAVGVSHPSLDRICQIVQDQAPGMAEAKLTGAGGGGCAMIVLHPLSGPQIANNLQRTLENKKHPWDYTCFTSTVGREGVLWIDPDLFPERKEPPPSWSDGLPRKLWIGGVIAAVASAAVVLLQPKKR